MGLKTPSPIAKTNIDAHTDLFFENKIVNAPIQHECCYEWMTTEEAADFLRLSTASLRNMASDGKVPYHKLGGRNRYLKSDLVNLLLSQKRGVSNGN